MRFVQPLDALNDFGLEGIHNLHRIVAQGGKNQEPAFGECREMIDTTFDTAHRYFLNELQRRKFSCRRLRRRDRSLCISHHKQAQSTQSHQTNR